MAGLRDNVEQALRNSGSISSGDMGGFKVPDSTKAAITSRPGADIVVQATPAPEGPIENIADGPTASEDLQDLVDPTPLDSTGLIDVTLTADERARFLESLVNNTRFCLPFSLYGGRVNGVLRSKTSGESRALLLTMHRKWSLFARSVALAGAVPDSEYSTTMRYALLMFQLAELNGVAYPEVPAPLLAAPSGADESGRELVSGPAWYDNMFGRFEPMGEAITTALYNELRKFEQKYWTLVRHSDDQNFWNPAQSTTA